MEPERMNDAEFKEHLEGLGEIHERIRMMKVVADNPYAFSHMQVITALKDALSILIPSIVYTEGKAEIEGLTRHLKGE